MATGGSNGDDLDQLSKTLQGVHLDVMDESDDYV